MQSFVLIVFACFSGCWNQSGSDREKLPDIQNPQVIENATADNDNKVGQPETINTEQNTQTEESQEPIDIAQLPLLPPRMDWESKGILADMIKTYKEANSYGDHGYVELKYELFNGEPQTEIRNCTFAFQKPNKVRMEVHQGQLVSDGTMLLAQATGNSELFGQILEKPAPGQISINDLYNDYLLAGLMDLGVPPEMIFVPPQIVLLFAEDPLQTLVPEGAEIRMGMPEYIISRDGQAAYPCDKIEVFDKLTGHRTYWVERGTNILLRMEIGVTHIRPSEVKPIAIKIELEGATILDPSETMPSVAFMLQRPVTSMPVKELMQPSLAMLGKRPEDAICTDENNQQINLAEPTQKGIAVAVLFVTDPNPQATESCKAALQNLQRLAVLFADNPNVKCFPVAVDEETVPHREISEALQNWGIDLPYFRQPGHEIMDRLRLSAVPTFLVFGSNGILQWIEPGIPAADDLAKYVDSALAGRDPYQEILAYYQAQKNAYHQSVEDFVSFDIFRTEPEYVQIADHTEPQTMTLTEMWRRTEFTNPGNPHVVASALLIPHDLQQFSVIGSDGKTQARNENGDPATIVPQGISADMPLHEIRSAAATGGQRYFAVTGINQKQLFLFDKDLNQILTWPQPADAGKYEIAAVQLADLTENGDPEIVIGYRVLAENTRRLAAINLSGTTIWEDRTVTEPDQIAIVLKNTVPHIWVINRYQETNSLVEFDAKGHMTSEWQVDAVGGLIWKIFAADLDKDGNSEVLAILPRAGELIAAGLNPNTSRTQTPLLWEQPISPGSHGVKSFEFVTTGDVNGDSIGEWCIAAADGTIYFVDMAGKLLDSFASGQLLSGMAIVPGNGAETNVAATLVLATSKDRRDSDSADDAVIAWKVTLKNPPQRTITTSEPEETGTITVPEPEEPVEANDHNEVDAPVETP